MRYLLLSVLSASVLALGGCATSAPLNLEKDGGSAASVIGVPSSQVKFVGYRLFGDIPLGDKHFQYNGQGVIVLTGDSLVLLEGDLPNAFVRQRVKYKEIGGVDVRHFGRDRQLQILKGNVVVVMNISKNKAMVDQEGTERAAEILRQHGIPHWQSQRHYRPKVPVPIIVPIPI